MIRLLFIIAGLLICWQAEARDVLSGPVSARVLKVRDGDTLIVEALIWPGQRVRVAVRLAGIDTPELRGECEDEKRDGLLARDAVMAMLDGADITLHDVRGGKYFGRVLARVVTAKGQDVGAALLRDRLARPYDGRKRASWCPSKVVSN